MSKKKLKTLVGSSAKTKSDEVQKEISFVRGFFSYTQNSNLVYECKVSSMTFYTSGILEWKPKDIYDNSNKNILNSVQNTKTVAPDIKNINGQKPKLSKHLCNKYNYSEAPSCKIQRYRA